MTEDGADGGETIKLYHITVPEGWDGSLRDSNGVLDGDVYLGVIDHPDIIDVWLRFGDIEVSSTQVEQDGEVYWRPSSNPIPLKAAVFNDLIKLRIVTIDGDKHRPTIGWYHLPCQTANEMFQNEYFGELFPNITVRRVGNRERLDKERSYKSINASESRPIRPQIQNGWRIRYGAISFISVD